ncbi:MAG: AraC family transcriptional regulator [Cyclobacteriaceae bacterium]
MSSLIEKKPEDPTVARFVEKYQLYAVQRPTWIKTVPNNRLECWCIFDGGFDIWNKEIGEFQTAPRLGGYPATANSQLLRIPDRLYCLNLKFHLRALALPSFQSISTRSSLVDTTSIIGAQQLGELHIDPDNYPGFDITKIDSWIKPLFQACRLEPMIERLQSRLDQARFDNVAALAEDLGISTRQLHRITTETFNLRPKELLSIYRFTETTRRARGSNSGKFLEALAFGYYDQSHFIRECKRIAGVTPKQLLAGMTLPTHDLMIIKS